jgi:hypothetical protein
MTRRPSARAAAALLGAAAFLLAAPVARAQTFDFEAAPPGFTPLTLTSGAITATFSNPGPLQLYEVLGPFPAGSFTGLSSMVLGTTPGTGDIFGPTPLAIVFGTPLTNVSLDFALTNQIPGTQLTLEAFLGTTPVGSVVTPAAAGPIFPEGTAVFGGTPFDNVLLSSDAADFAIDNLVVAAPAVVPEPATLGLAALGLAVLAAAGRARRRLTTPSARAAR